MITKAIVISVVSFMNKIHVLKAHTVLFHHTALMNINDLPIELG